MLALPLPMQAKMSGAKSVPNNNSGNSTYANAAAAAAAAASLNSSSNASPADNTKTTASTSFMDTSGASAGNPHQARTFQFNYIGGNTC